MWKVLRSAVAGNLGIKIISLLLGLVLWVYVNRQLHPLERETVMAEVRVENVGADLIPRVVPDELEVTIWVDKERLRLWRHFLKDLEDVVDATGKEAGRHEIAAELDLEGMPSGLKTTRRRFSPTRVQVRLQKLASKNLSVAWTYSSSPPAGFEIGEPLISPREVVVNGVEDELQSIASARVKIDFAGLVTKGGTSWLPVHLYDADGEPLDKPSMSVEPPLVSVTVRVTNIVTKVVPVVAQVEKTGRGFDISEVQVSPATATLTGAESALAAIDHVSTQTMTVTGRQETQSRTLPLELPAGLTVVGGPAEVEVTVVIRTLPTPPPEPGTEDGSNTEDGNSEGSSSPEPEGNSE